ncbi:histone deacetylase [Methylophaga sp. 42_8_T64]|nr:histone deacetylase [Methylophaga sp. 41_12_T18]OUR89492.1 histone deacetylase [Methylophaga sp. 42_8_T64]
MERRQFLALSSLATFAQAVIAADKKSHTGLVIDERFIEHHISPAHPESPARYQAISEQLLQQNLLSKLVLIKPKDNVEALLKLIHSEQHIESIKQAGLVAHQHAMLATGAVLAAVDAVGQQQVSNAFCASRPPGHHALNTGQEEGFCYYNHAALAARYVQQQYKLEKILIVDWDYHHGNGTEWAFYNDPSVLYFSTHDKFAYPGTGFPEREGEGEGKGFNINVHLGCGTTDDDIITVFEQRLRPAVAMFKPDFIIISAGFDSREDDLLGCHKITDQGFAQLTKIVKNLAQQHCHGRLVSLLEGGYNIQGNASAVISHLTELIK